MRSHLNEELLEFVSQKVKKERLKVNLSQNQLSLKAGLNYTYVGMIERKRYLPSLEVMKKICDVLDISLSNFFEGL